MTGRFGFKTLDVSDPTKPEVLDTLRPADILGPDGYWQDADMDVDRRRKLIIGALDPRHDDVDQVSCPGTGTLTATTRNRGCRSGFYVISYAKEQTLRCPDCNGSWESVTAPKTAYSQAKGRLAQLGEHQLDKLGVTGSSPVPPTIRNPRLAGVSSSRVSGAAQAVPLVAQTLVVVRSGPDRAS